MLFQSIKAERLLRHQYQSLSSYHDNVPIHQSRKAVKTDLKFKRVAVKFQSIKAERLLRQFAGLYSVRRKFQSIKAERLLRLNEHNYILISTFQSIKAERLLRLWQMAFESRGRPKFQSIKAERLLRHLYNLTVLHLSSNPSKPKGC